MLSRRRNFLAVLSVGVGALSSLPVVADAYCGPWFSAR